MNNLFRQFSHKSSELLGTPLAFLLAVGVIVVWAVTGPAFHFSDTWQLIINTGTTVITFLMVFLIQSTQNRESLAIQLKLDELLRAIRSARTEMVRLEDLSDEELKKLREEFGKLAGTPAPCNEDDDAASPNAADALVNGTASGVRGAPANLSK